MKSKKALIGILLVILGLFLMLFIGVLLVIGSATIDWVTDIVVPEFKDLGMIGDSNLSATATTVFTPIDTFVQNLTWLTGVAYVFGIIAIFGLAFMFRATGSRWMIGLFIALIFILVLASIFISNIYEDIYDGDDDLAIRLKEHVLISYMILYSPLITTIIAFLAGIILFGGTQEEGII